VARDLTRQSVQSPMGVLGWLALLLASAGIIHSARAGNPPLANCVSLLPLWVTGVLLLC
jgi:hypothetical protein